MDDCPFCGAEYDPEQQGWKAYYLCKTGFDGGFYRGAYCYEVQIATQAALLEECKEKVQGILTEFQKFQAGEYSYPHTAMIRMVGKAVFILSKLEAATEKP